MAADDQRDIVEFLLRPESYPGSVGEVGHETTHISHVFLAGDRAWKLKRAVRYSYLDFSTPEQRRAACEAEIRVNRRTAPDMYLGLGAVMRRADGALVLAPPEQTPKDAFEWLVVMRRFRQEDMFDDMARRAVLDRSMMEALAEAIARFHERTEPAPRFGGRAGMASILDLNVVSLRDAGAGIIDAADIGRFAERGRKAVDTVGDLLDARRRDGRVRRCHGDLHLRNICLFEGRPTLFDAIEFSDEIACIDILYDLAFLLMDLEERGLRPLANAAFNRYLQITGDYGGLAALPLFLACRAAIRSHVSASASRSADAAAGETLRDDARRYLRHALDFLDPPPPRLIAVGGVSGTGKSTLARSIAPEIGPAPGAVHLRSDVTRKRLLGARPLDRLPEAAYRADVTERVYETLVEAAKSVVGAGHGVIADAVFARPGQRAAIEQAGRRASTPFTGLWLEAPRTVLEARVAERSGDVSDADVTVVRRQLAFDLGPISWRRVDASGDPAQSVRRARDAIAIDVEDR